MRELPQSVRDEIIRLFLLGQSVNHIVFLLDYEWNADYVNMAIRDRLRELLEQVGQCA